MRIELAIMLDTVNTDISVKYLTLICRTIVKALAFGLLVCLREREREREREKRER